MANEDKYTTVVLGEHVISTTDGSQVEFVTEEGKTYLVHVRMREGCGGDPAAERKPDPQVIARAVLVGDGKIERSNVFQDYVILPASWVEASGEILCNDRGLEANGVAYYAQERRMVPLYPAVYWRNGVATKESHVVYRTEGRSKDPGMKVSEIKVKVPEPA